MVWGVFLLRRRPGKKAARAPQVPTWNNLFPFGFELQGRGNKKRNRRRGLRFRRLQVSRISCCCFLSLSFFFLLPPLLFPFVGNKHISKDELCLSLVNVLHILEDGAAIMMCDVYIRLLDTRIPPFEILLTSKYLNRFSKGLWKTAPWIALLTSYFARLWQIWRGGVVLIHIGEPIVHNHH